MAFPEWMGIIQSICLNKQKGERKGNSISLPDCPATLILRVASSVIQVLRPSDSDCNSHHPSSCSQLLHSVRNDTTGFPGAPVCRQQMMGLLSFHNNMNQFHVINIFISYWFCFSEPIKVQRTN